MDFKPINRDELKALLHKNWMTHDALWYKEVASKLGMAEASPMNLRICRTLGRIEFQRLIQVTGVSSPKNMAQYRHLFEKGKEIFVPDFMKFKIHYQEPNRQVFQVWECFAYTGMVKAGLISEYECGIFERIKGWLDTMDLEYSLHPELKRCPKFEGNECRVTITFDFSKEN